MKPRKGIFLVLAMVSMFLLTSCDAGRKMRAWISPKDALRDMGGCGGKEEKKEVKKEEKKGNAVVTKELVLP